MMCYADDSTFTTSAPDRKTNQETIKVNMENMKIFLIANKLCINESKSGIIESMIKQKRCKAKGQPPSLQVFNKKENKMETLNVSKDAKLLGINISDDLTWKAHLQSGTDKPLLPSLRSKLGTLKHLGKNMSEKSRNTLAQGIILSRIHYALPLWGGTTENYLKKIQVVMNNAARTVTGLGRRTSTRTLMERCGWLTCKEAVIYLHNH